MYQWERNEDGPQKLHVTNNNVYIDGKLFTEQRKNESFFLHATVKEYTLI